MTLPSPPQPPSPKLESKIILPEDLQIRACVMYAAGMSLQYKLFSKYPYQIDYKNQQITSLTGMRRDISKANVEYLAALKRDGKTIGEIPEETLDIKKWVLSLPSLILILAVTATIVFYGNNNIAFRNEIVAFWNSNSWLVEGLAIVIITLYAIVLFTRRRRPKAS